VVVSSPPARAEITAVVIDKVAPFAEGLSFGDVGGCERVIGTAKGELDPKAAAKLGIVDLAKAPAERA
jgi:hypothetical protein